MILYFTKIGTFDLPSLIDTRLGRWSSVIDGPWEEISPNIPHGS